MFPYARLRSLTLSIILILASFDGFSQDHYFQQQVNHRISVKLNHKNHTLSAYETVEYINNSPDTLRFLYFHLWPNAYSNNKTPLARQLLTNQGKQKLFKDARERGFIDSLDFRSGNKAITWEILPDNPDICVLHPDLPVCPGQSIMISTPFRVKIPETSISRMGYSGGAYQVSQWYPKPAVYDSNGWHPISYLDQGEFFSEFGNFDVRITLPENYTVAASGELLTGTEIERLKRLSDGNYPSDWDRNISSEKTIDYKGENVHDFAWVAGKNFLVRVDTVILPGSGRSINTAVMYTPAQAFIWNDALDYVKTALLRFSDWIGEYPYGYFVAVQSAIAAGSGMEYPGMTVIGNEDDGYSLDEVIAHEICHSWFYGALGFNERRYPFLDEGLASAYEERYLELRYPGKKLWEVYMRSRKMAKFFHITGLPVGLMSEIQWLAQARNNLEQPADLSSEKFTERNYTDIIYYKSAKGFNYLRGYLGNNQFDSLMHEFYFRWSGKHPSPDDLRKVFEQGSGQNLSWFFDEYLGTIKRADYSISKLRDDSLLVRNKGELNVPFQIYSLRKGEITSLQWVKGFPGKKWIPLDNRDFDELKINYSHQLPEINHLNNNISRTGLFRKYDPLRIQMVLSIEDPSERSIMLTPLVNWTRVDGFMIGAGLNNGTLLPKKTEIFAVPFYTFRNHGIAGTGRIAYNITPYDNFIRKVVISLSGVQYGSPWTGHYHVIESGLDVHLRSNDPLSFIDHMFFARVAMAKKTPLTDFETDHGNEWFEQAGYTLDKGGLINPYRLTGLLETNGNYMKSSAELRYRLSYNGRNRGLDIRIFAGAMLKEDTLRKFYSLAPSGRSGRELYMYQGDFPDRFAVFPSSFWSRQMIMNEGGLVSPVNDTIGYNPWLISASFTSSLPGKAAMIPLKPFVNVLWNGQKNFSIFGEAGFKAGIWDIFEIYVPLVVSDNIRSIRSTVKERIRFTLNLQSLFRVRLN